MFDFIIGLGIGALGVFIAMFLVLLWTASAAYHLGFFEAVKQLSDQIDKARAEVKKP